MRRARLPACALAVLAVLVALLAGCNRHRGAPGPRTADERGVRRLERLARRDLDCAEVRLTHLRDAAYQVDGCGRLAEYAYVCTARRCEWESIEAAVRHAERDLGCTRDLLSGSAPAAMRRDFVGCGRAISYSLECNTVSCGWQPLLARAPAGAATASAGPTPSGSSLEMVSIPPAPGSSAPGSIPPAPGASAASDSSLAIELELEIPAPASAASTTPTDDLAVPAPSR